ANLELAIIFEHKSGLNTDGWPLDLQLLKYFSGIAEENRKRLMRAKAAGQKEATAKILPHIIVFYHGEHGFKPQTLAAYYGLEGPLASFGSRLPKVEYTLYDLQALSNDQLEQDYADSPDLLSGLLLLKNIWGKSLKKMINRVFKHAGRFLRDEEGKHFFHHLGVYLGKRAKDKKELGTLLEEIKDDHIKHTAMNAYEEMMLESRIEGEARGEARGEVKGETKKSEEVVVAMLKRGKYGLDEIVDIAGVSYEFINQIKVRYQL
ncbi:MAG: Rpn family recombination-promoting nuclease/putative transposase, partial [Cyanobacteria bacterium P01_H01_bin.74]